MNTQAIRDAISAALISEMSLPSVKSDWSYAQRLAYNKAFADRVLNLGAAAGFSGTEIATAAHISSNPGAPLEDTSFDWGIFGDEVLNQAQKKLDRH